VPWGCSSRRRGLRFPVFTAAGWAGLQSAGGGGTHRYGWRGSTWKRRFSRQLLQKPYVLATRKTKKTLSAAPWLFIADQLAGRLHGAHGARWGGTGTLACPTCAVRISMKIEGMGFNLVIGGIGARMLELLGLPS